MTKKINFTKEIDFELAKSVMENFELMDTGVNPVTNNYEVKFTDKTGNEIIFELVKPKEKK